MTNTYVHGLFLYIHYKSTFSINLVAKTVALEWSNGRKLIFPQEDNDTHWIGSSIFYLATCNQRFGTATSCIMCNELGMLYMGGSHLRPVLRACLKLIRTAQIVDDRLGETAPYSGKTRLYLYSTDINYHTQNSERRYI